MSEAQAHEDDNARNGTGQRGIRPRSLFMLAVAFLVGLALGASIMWVTQRPQGDATTGPPSQPSPSAIPTLPRPSEEPAISERIVPEACLEAAQSAERLVGLVRQVATALGDYDAERLVRLVDRIEALDRQIQPQVRQCRSQSER